MFKPPRCPNRQCQYHRTPVEGFCQFFGYYRVKCRPEPIPRFRCDGCRKTFSRQTFRMDYCDHRPELNQQVLMWLASSVGLRQMARQLPIDRKSLRRKVWKIGLHLRKMHENLSSRAELSDRTFVLDELETFEGSKLNRPVTVANAIDQKTMFVVGSDVATLAPRRQKARPAAIAAEEKRHGKRRNHSNRIVRKVLRRAAKLVADDAQVTLVCDKKTTYPKRAQEAFGDRLCQVFQHSGKRQRDTKNPLFRINLTHAMMRDNNGCLRRRSWLASKKRSRLSIRLAFFIAYRNYQRLRINGSRGTPAQELGICRDALKNDDVLSWRQDWRERSIPVALPGPAVFPSRGSRRE